MEQPMSDAVHHDLSGDRITVSGDAARLAWNATLEALMAHAAATPEHLARTLGADPDFALAHAAKGLMLLTLARAELVAPARDCLGKARAAAVRRPVTRRETMVIEALALWLDDAPRRAAERLEAILLAHPFDVLALKLSHGLRFMLGDQAQMLATLNRYAPGFGETHPLAGFVHGCHAFALEERGFYAQAERTGRRAVALSPRDAWGRHAVAHCLEMTGRAEEGARWLEATTDTWRHCTSFAFHISWHLALFLLDQGRTGEVLDLYDTEIRATRADDYRDLANGASMLARLEFEGVDVGDRWEELAELSARRVSDRRLVFADLHYATALLGAGATADAEALAGHMLADASRGTTHDGRVAAAAGVAAMEGLFAFHAGRYAEAARHLLRARPDLPRIGGSIAQRDLFEQMLAESLIRSGDLASAEAMLRERLLRRGGHNGFAARRLARLAGGRRPAGRVAALAMTMLAPAAAH